MNDVHVFVTDFGNVRISGSTLAAMDATFPGWRNPSAIKGRTKAIREARNRAKQGSRLLFNATRAIHELVWTAEQELIQI